ncbi:hypothetical protein K402DRAFT_191332 [Aulographum hederae CBS 113979]|uniref:Uncharacterized protein n=1 Tax=Aulographum hederae CBS 113979 TaxID=1176131 RepID=A0A6G1GNV5_9PEZI|nr:hypothetical protein K402DRAFT_191332 [Aulographum hederae CBS 113979]
MENTYEHCFSMKGKDVSKLRPQYFEDNVLQPSALFMVVKDLIEDEGKAIIEASRDKLEETVSALYETIKKDFGRCCSKAEFETPEGKAFRQSLEEQVNTAKEILKGPIQEKLTQCSLYKDKN